MQCVERPQGEGYGETGPQHPVLEQGLHRPRVGAVLLYHGQGQLHHGVGEPFVFHPLLAQDHHDAGHRQKQGQGKDPPPGQRPRPGSPGNHTPGTAFVELPQRIATLRQRPDGQIGLDDITPVILRCAVVGGPGDDGQNLTGETTSRQRVGHQDEDVGDGQLGLCQGPRTPQPAESGVDDEDEGEKHADRPGGPVPGGQPGPLDHHVIPGRPEAQQQSARQAGEQGAETAAAAGFVLFGIGHRR